MSYIDDNSSVSYLIKSSNLLRSKNKPMSEIIVAYKATTILSPQVHPSNEEA